MWDVAVEKCLLDVKVPHAEVTSLCSSADESLLCAGTAAGSLWLLDSREGNSCRVRRSLGPQMARVEGSRRERKANRTLGRTSWGSGEQIVGARMSQRCGPGLLVACATASGRLLQYDLRRPDR